MKKLAMDKRNWQRARGAGGQREELAANKRSWQLAGGAGKMGKEEDISAPTAERSGQGVETEGARTRTFWHQTRTSQGGRS